jgi:LPPG:FO 2-phospho-L-lactate transferase
VILVETVMPRTADSEPTFPRVAVLSGGFGGARLLPALSEIVPAGHLRVIANVGDDLTWFGLRVCPDVDSILYSLAGLWNQTAGYGVRGETFHTLDRLSDLDCRPWFNVGDRDLALHLLRTAFLQSGLTLTEATQELARRLGIQDVEVIPASDEPGETHVVLDDGRVLHFQEWYVKERGQPPVRQVRMARGSASPAALEALYTADTVILGPSSPVASVGPILALDEVRDAVLRAARRIAVCPVVRHTGPVSDAVAHHSGARQRLLAAEGAADAPVDIAERYADLVQHFVLDRRDDRYLTAIRRLGLNPVTCDLLSPSELADVLVRLSLRGAPV